MSMAERALVLRRCQDAVDLVLSSEHDSSKVAACIFDPNDENIFAVHTNHRPQALSANLPPEARIGSSSAYVHAEVSCIFGFEGHLRGSHICLTDPFCPNCAKFMAEAGVRSVYIDHKGFQKDFASRRGGEFKDMSMLIAEKAGISVFIVNRKEGSVEPILDHPHSTRPSPSAIEFFDVEGDNSADLKRYVDEFKTRLGVNSSFAVAIANETNGKPVGILVFEALPPGLTPEEFSIRKLQADNGKYRFPMDPLNRLMILLRRQKMTLAANGTVACSFFPSSRALVNAVSFGVRNIIALRGDCDHDRHGQEAARTLNQAGCLDFLVLPG